MDWCLSPPSQVLIFRNNVSFHFHLIWHSVHECLCLISSSFSEGLLIYRWISYFITWQRLMASSELKTFFTGSSIIILKPIQENIIYFWVPKPRLMYLLVMLHLKLAQKKLYLESWLTQNSVLTNTFLPFVVKLARNYMP